MLKQISPPFTIGPVTQAVYDLLVSYKDTDTIVTHRDLEKTTGKSLEELRGSISVAIRRVQKDFGKHFGNVPGIGYRVIADEELPRVGRMNRNRSRNLHKRTKRILEAADGSKQSVAARAQTIVELSVANMSLDLSAPRTLSRVQQTVVSKNNELDFSEQIEIIKEALTRKVK